MPLSPVLVHVYTPVHVLLHIYTAVIPCLAAYTALIPCLAHATYMLHLFDVSLHLGTVILTYILQQVHRASAHASILCASANYTDFQFVSTCSTCREDTLCRQRKNVVPMKLWFPLAKNAQSAFAY